VYPFRPSIEFIPSIAWKLFRYGFWIGAGLTILYASQNVDVFIGGNVISHHMKHGVRDMGFYTTSWKLAFIAASIFTLMASSMVFPTLSRMRDNLPGLRQTLLKSIRQLGLVMFPAAALLAVIAPVLIGPILGSKWSMYRDQFIVLSLLAVYAGNRTMLSIFFEGYKSIGKPSVVWWYNAVKLAIMAPAMYFAAHHGIVGLASVYIPVQIIEIPAALYLANRLIGVSPAAVTRAASTPILTTLLMSAAVVIVELALTRGVHLSDAITLAACLVTAAIVYLGTIYIFDKRIILEAKATLVKGL
jgi:O-antigen/teichoic acid export membrane protein